MPRPDEAALGHARPDVGEPAARRAVALDRRGARLAGAFRWRSAARARGRDRGVAQLRVMLRRIVGRALLLGVAFVAGHVRDHVARRQARAVEAAAGREARSAAETVVAAAELHVVAAPLDLLFRPHLLSEAVVGENAGRAAHRTGLLGLLVGAVQWLTFGRALVLLVPESNQ